MFSLSFHLENVGKLTIYPEQIAFKFTATRKEIIGRPLMLFIPCPQLILFPVFSFSLAKKEIHSV